MKQESLNTTKHYSRRIAVTGGAGFIGSNLLLQMVPKYPSYLFVNVDSLTYAGNLSNLLAISAAPNYRFERVNICDRVALESVFQRYEITDIIHLAAESHVDRSIEGPAEFIQTNIIGTFNLLELARLAHLSRRQFRFHHVSTDEVFGSLGATGKFCESTPYAPNSPYAASKASSDHLVRAYHTTYDLDSVTTNCSNNYGPYQFPEKLIPLMIRNACTAKPLPVYGDGQHVRDWLYVEDHCRALDLAFHKGESGETYCIGGNNEVKNLDLVRMLCTILDKRLGGDKRERLITYVADRKGHDRRYAIDAGYIKKSLGWSPTVDFESGLAKTVDWYLSNDEWMVRCVSGEYMNYYEKMYGNRQRV
jgi:dTDP-glucose 4,6-dehydratase